MQLWVFFTMLTCICNMFYTSIIKIMESYIEPYSYTLFINGGSTIIISGFGILFGS